MRLATILLVTVLGTVLVLTAALGAEIIIDNPSASFSGTWQYGTMSTDKYGVNYQFANVSSSGGSTATYIPSIPAPGGQWEVFAWYPQGTNRPTQARYIIHHAGGDTIKYLNQQTNGGRWNSLGTYTFNGGTSGYVRVSNQGSETTKVVMADAIRFYSGTPDVTPPNITAVVANAGYDTATITWTTDETATSQVEYGTSTSYGSLTPVDSDLVVSHAVSLSGLTPGTLYHFRVISADGVGNSATSVDYTFTTTTTPPGPEFRASWLDSWGTGFRTASEVTSVINTLDAYNYNALVFEARKNGDACYNSSYEYKDTNISPASFDPLADMIAKGHAKGIEIHAWLVAYRIASESESNAPPVYDAHPDWLMKDSSGGTVSGGFYHLDPGVPGVQDYICKIVMDIATRYDVDGINFDYIRYPGETYGYNDYTRERFRQDYGSYPLTVKPSTSDPNYAAWTAWCNFRRQQVTDLVKKCYLEIMAVKPQVKVSICGITWGGVGSYTNSSAYASVFQDFRKWQQDHVIDMTVPMNYKREHDATQASDYRDWCNFNIANRNGRHTYIIQGSYMNTIANSMTQLQYALDAGADGVCTYDYWDTNNEGKTKEEFYSTVRAQKFTSKVPTPEMTWKTNPTTGIIFGTVTNAAKPNDPIYQNWVYKANVTVTGPETRTTQTDGTGTYGFIDLPPGTYTITVSKSGFPTRTYTGQVLKAGDVVREDFDLGYTTATSPAGATGTGSNWFSLPLEPVNPTPAAVLPGIRLDCNLYRWDNPTQSQVAYDDWATFLFGDMNVQDGYDLFLDAPYTISYQALGGSPAMRDIPIPSTGSALIGCPFTRNVDWEQVLVTKNGVTVDMRTASKTNNWLSSTAFWWNAAEQSQYDVALPEDFPTGGTQLLPWHSYWVNTYTDGLTLTLK